MNRPIGIFYAYWVHDWDVDYLPFVDKVKKLGFDQLELQPAILTNRPKAYRLTLREKAEKEGSALSYCLALEKKYDVSSSDEKVRQRGVAFVKKVILAIEEMGGGSISGPIYNDCPFVGPRDKIDKPLSLKQSIKSMKEMAPFAVDHGVSLNVEVLNRSEHFLLNTAAEALAYVKEVNSPGCNILLDTFHMNSEEDSMGDAIRLAGKRLGHFHLGEPNRKLPGMGRMPWGEIKKALDDIKYTGPLVLEPFISPGGAIGQAIGVWRELVKNPNYDALAEKAVAFVKENIR
jgi:D-psicose/D-tagatose/L-ribulose 3-epimerase